MWCIGGKEEAVLGELAGNNPDLRRKVMAGGRVLYSYRKQWMDRSEGEEERWSG